MSKTSEPAEPIARDEFPAGIPFIVGNEGAERFSFYGMKSILYVYLTALFIRFVDEGLIPAADLASSKANATEVVHLFVAGVYAFPLIGAIISDRLLGKYNVIFWVSLIYCAGHAVLAFAGRLGSLGEFGGAEIAVFIGLGLIAMGSGGIKPCVSANVGDQFTAKNSHLVTKIFQIFYFIINFGSFFSTLLTPFLYKTVGPEIAFGVPGILMAVATFVFWLGRKRFVRVPANPGGKLGIIDSLATILLFSPLFSIIYGYFVMWGHFQVPEGSSTFGAFLGYYWPLLLGTSAAIVAGFTLFGIRQKMKPDTGFLAVLVYSLRHQKDRKPGQGFFDVARQHFGEEAGDGPAAVLRIIVVFSMVSVFWALFDQHASTWVEQAKQMDLGFTVPVFLFYAAIGVVVGLAIFGGTWLMLRLSNVLVPNKVNFGIVGLAVLILVAAGLVDLARGETMFVQLQAAQLAALNPLMVMMIIPFLNIAVWIPLGKRGIIVKPLRKMTMGMFLAAIAFAAAAFLQMRIEAAGVGQVHALWQVIPYLLITTSEVLVSVTGLEFAYTQAPRAMKSTIMGFWLLCVTFGNLIVAFLAPLQKQYALSDFFWLFAGLMCVASVVFTILAHFYKGKTYLQA